MLEEKTKGIGFSLILVTCKWQYKKVHDNHQVSTQHWDNYCGLWCHWRSTKVVNLLIQRDTKSISKINLGSF